MVTECGHLGAVLLFKMVSQAVVGVKYSQYVGLYPPEMLSDLWQPLHGSGSVAVHQGLHNALNNFVTRHCDNKFYRAK